MIINWQKPSLYVRMQLRYNQSVTKKLIWKVICGTIYLKSAAKLKSDNLLGLLGCWDNHLIDQASEVQSIIVFFIIFFKILCKNHFNLFIVYQNKRSFECPKPTTHCTVLFSIYQNSTWTIRRQWDNRPCNPAYYIEYCQISSCINPLEQKVWIGI